MCCGVEMTRVVSDVLWCGEMTRVVSDVLWCGDDQGSK